MRINIIRLKSWMLIHMMLMNMFLIFIVTELIFQVIMLCITIYFLVCITENEVRTSDEARP